MTKNESEFVLMCAVDYVINRHTYAPEMLSNIIIKQWSVISDETKKYIKKAIERNYTNCDPAWHNILKL